MLGLIWGERSDRGRSQRTMRRIGAARRARRPAPEGLEQRIALSGTDVWLGTTSSSWSEPTNWSPAAVPVSGDSLVFPATSNPSSNNDIGTTLALGSITIQGAGYNLTGNSISLSNGITASYTTGVSIDAIPTALTAVVAPIVVARGGTLNITGPLSGSAGMTITGGGTLDLGALNTYTGPTIIGSGTALLVDGAIAGVQDSGGLLAGNQGSVGGVSSVGGAILPGFPATATTPQASPGQLTSSSSVTLDSASQFLALLNGTSPGNGTTGYSQLIVSSGTLSLGGARFATSLGTSYIPAVGDQLIVILNNTGTPIIGTFSNLPEGGAVTAGKSLFRINYLGTNGSGNSVVLTAVAATTTTKLLPVQIPTSPNQPFTISAQVSGSQGTPTGVVEFFNGNPTSGGIMLASATVSPLTGSTGLATATVPSLGTGGSPLLYAVFIPTPTTFTYAGSTSSPISFATTTTLISSSPVSLIGQPVTFTATVSPASANAGTPTGSVEFIADTNTVLGTVPINPSTGQASLTTSSLAIGTHSIVAQFISSGPFQDSTSSTLTQSVSTAGVVPTLTLVPLLNRHGRILRFALVATMQPTLQVGIVPTGTVTYFIDGRAYYRTVPLSNGAALLVRPWSRLVNHYVFLRYNGSPTFVASASSEVYLSHRRLTLLARQAKSGRLRTAEGRSVLPSRHPKAR